MLKNSSNCFKPTILVLIFMKLGEKKKEGGGVPSVKGKERTSSTADLNLRSESIACC